MIITPLKGINQLLLSLYLLIAGLFNINISYATVTPVMTEQKTPSIQLSAFERQIAAKMALDIRYFCAHNTEEHCLEPVTKLPTALANMISHSGIGSIVLFAENLVSSKQVIQLTHDLQQAALNAKSKQPLIISIDQEGGRVVRLPHATSFAGNMAIGATYSEHGVKFATDISTIIGQELNALGINNNYAPVVDVNTNANNPVINTRSFGESPQQVAELGVASVNALQQQSVMATLKHFPGHGDTHVDSHLGLPLVAHDLVVIEKQDLAPFQWAIEHSDPAMIMTAHIQYPALDSSTIENMAGEKIIRPATMSRKILTDLLRDRMGFKGIIATDALDMAGIAHYFDEVNAVVETFVAGADLAVMPFKVRQIDDINEFYLFVKAVAASLQEKMAQTKYHANEFEQSLARINSYKAQYCQLPTTPLTERINNAEQLIAQRSHLKLEQTLANNAVVLLTNLKQTATFKLESVARIHLFVLNWQEFGALKQAIISQWQHFGDIIPQVSATVVADGNAQQQLASGEKLAKAQLVIATVDTKIASVVDLGGVEDLLTPTNHVDQSNNAQTKVSYEQLLSEQLHQAKQSKVPSVLIAKGSPYLLSPYAELADKTFVTFDDRIYKTGDGNHYSPGYQASLAIMLGLQKAKGIMPVSLLAK